MSHKPGRDTAGRTHLHRACQRGAVAEVETILSQGKEFLNEEDNAGYMPLHEACLHGHLGVVKVLINNGAWLDIPSRLELDTPLLDAVDNGHTDVAKYLLELGADPRKRNRQGQTALDANDANRETPDVFQEIEDLLKVAINKLRTRRYSDDENPRTSAAADSHSSRDPSVASPVHQSPQAPSAPTANRHRITRMEQIRRGLLRLDARKNGLLKLRETAREGDQQMVHALLERGAKPDTASLIGAIQGGHADTVSLLLAHNAIVDPEPGNPGRDGSRKSQDTSIPAGEETPMLAAIGRGNLVVLRYLLEQGVDPRRRDSKGKSYVDIARERKGELWKEEVDMLKKAWDKAGGGRESRTDKARNPSPTHKGSSPKPKKTTDGKTAPSSSRRSNYISASSLYLKIPPRRSSSINPSKYDNTTAVFGRESAPEPPSPPRPRRKSKRSESDSISSVTAKKKRRLISASDLAEERSLDIPKSTPTGGDTESKDPKSLSHRPQPEAVGAHRAPVREPPAWRLDYRIGTGACGIVFLENVHIPGMKSPELWAVKRIPRALPNFTFKRYQAEINNLQLLARHEWFVKFNSTYEDTHYMYIAMEYIPMGDMSQSFADGYRWNESDTKVVIKQLLHGLAIMHKEGITHRDLKPENIFLYLPENQTNVLRVKIGDFGTSKRIPLSNASTYLKTTTGTQGYMAPEAHDTSQPKTNRVDIWSLGCILYRMSAGNLLFNDPVQVWKYALAASSSPLAFDNIGFSIPCVSFLRDVLQPIPEDRPSAEDCQKKSWIMNDVPGPGYSIGMDLYTRLSKINQRAPNVYSFLDLVANRAADSSSIF